MGLLDDAIREHLELKRKHGADPEDVARQEQEALGPGVRNEFAQPPGEPELEPPVAAAPPESAAVADPPPEPVDVHDPAVDPGYEEDPWLVEDEADEVPADEALERRAPAPAATEPDAERDDVLEDTPDFLQETPEHDRLWFEQKPPRDFDWDK